MPRLISTKNLRHPTIDGYVLSSSTSGVQSWVSKIDNVGFSSDGSNVGTAKTINFQSNRIEVQGGITTVYSDPLTIIGL
jgi:hypothetical protein